MKVKTISVTYDRKLNLGDYNSLNLAVTVWADLEDGENHLVAIKTLQDDARDSVRNEFGRIREKGSSSSSS